MTPYRERAHVPVEQPETPQTELVHPRRIIVRKPGTPLVVWMLLMAFTTAIVVSQMHLR